MPAMSNYGQSWPPSRFIQAAEMYTHEFEAILAEVEAPKDQQFYFTTRTKECLLFHIFSNIRYHLRRLLDLPPLGFTLSDNKPSHDYSKCRAQTYKLVEMSPPDLEKVKFCNEPVLWETSISYVFNIALRYIHTYFLSMERIKSGFYMQNDLFTSPNKTPASYPISQASYSSLDLRSVDLFENEFGEVVEDIQGARLVFGALGAAQFVLELLDWPGVKDAIDDAGGWAPIEKTAFLLKHHCLTNDNIDLAHFELLVDVAELRRRLLNDLNEIKSASDAAQTFLEDIWSQLKKCK
jgi:hypothetical protein